MDKLHNGGLVGVSHSTPASSKHQLLHHQNIFIRLLLHHLSFCWTILFLYSLDFHLLL
uniref:Uncharacterized protein n=1 Tax=Rhizophora mucronata TaxID=61149 RepID=A0A2P2IMF0_RHIMU